LHIEDTCNECADTVVPVAQLLSLSCNSGAQVEAGGYIRRALCPVSMELYPTLVFFAYFSITMRPKKT